MKTVVFVVLAVLMGILVIPPFLFLLFGLALETPEELYQLLVNYGVIKPRAGDAQMWEIRNFCKMKTYRRECGDCPYRVKTGCGFAGPPGEWSEDVLNGKRKSWRSLWS